MKKGLERSLAPNPLRIGLPNPCHLSVYCCQRHAVDWVAVSTSPSLLPTAVLDSNDLWSQPIYLWVQFTPNHQQHHKHTKRKTTFCSFTPPPSMIFFCIYLSNFDICSFFVLGRCLRQLIQFVIKTNQVFKQMARISCIIGRKLGKRAIWHNMFPSFTHMCNNSKCHPPFLV